MRSYLEEVFGEVAEHGVECVVVQVAVFVASVMVVVDEVLYVVVGADELYVLKTPTECVKSIKYLPSSFLYCYFPRGNYEVS